MTERSVKRGVLAGAVLSLPLLLYPNLASAQFFSSQLPIAACQNSGTTGTVSYDWVGMLNSSTTQNLFLDCGAYMSDDSGSTAYSVQLSFFNRSQTENLTCGLKLISQGLIVFTGPTKTLGSSGNTGPISTTWTIAANLGGLPYVSCKIPKATASGFSGIAGIDLN